MKGIHLISISPERKVKKRCRGPLVYIGHFYQRWSVGGLLIHSLAGVGKLYKAYNPSYSDYRLVDNSTRQKPNRNYRKVHFKCTLCVLYWNVPTLGPGNSHCLGFIMTWKVIFYIPKFTVGKADTRPRWLVFTRPYFIGGQSAITWSAFPRIGPHL